MRMYDMASFYRNFRFWTGFVIFLVINFETSGFQTLRDGIVVDYFVTKRHTNGLICGLGQAFYAIGQGLALIASLTCIEFKVERSMNLKHQFLWTSFLVTKFSIFIGLGVFITDQELFIWFPHYIAKKLFS